MKIAFLTTGTLENFSPTRRVLGLARHIVDYGFEPHVLLPGWEPNLKEFASDRGSDVRIHFTGCSVSSEPFSKYQILKLIQPDFLHAVDVAKRVLLPALAYRWAHPCKLVVDIGEQLSPIYGLFKNAFRLAMIQLALRSGDCICVASRTLEQQYRNSTACLSYLPYALELELFEEHRVGWEEVKEQWQGRKVVTYLGSFFPRYETERVVELGVRLATRREDLLFMLIGSGPLREPLSRQVEQHGLGDRIRFLGFVPDEQIPRLLCASDVLVFPIKDTWINRTRCPSKTFYYLATGLPVVTNNVGEVPEVFGESAFYFDYDNVDDFVATVERCLDRGHRLSEEERQRRAAPHSWRARTQEYVEILNHLGATSKRP